MHSSSLQFFLAVVASSLSFLSSTGVAQVIPPESQVKCTVSSILSTTLRGVQSVGAVGDYEYVCTADSPIISTYKIYGDVRSLFTGLEPPAFYQSSVSVLTFPSSIVGDDKVIDLSDDIVRASVSVSPHNIFLSDQSQNQSQGQQNTNEGTFKGLAIRVVDSTGDEPVESANEIYGAFFDDSINFGVSVKSVLSGCSAGKFNIIPATGSALTNGVIEITVNYAVAGQYYSDVSDDVFNLLPSTGIDDYTYTFMIFPESVNLSSSGGNTVGKGSFPGTKTWYKSTYVQYVTLGVHEIGHNLYLGHSGADYNNNGVFDDDEEEYDDPSCTMGGEYGSTSDGQKCFNAAKVYYLGWFSDYQGDMTPTNNAFGGTLVGVNDAGNDEISPDQYVTVRVSDSGATDLYLMYNRVEGVNKFLENIYYRDKVVVVEQDGAGEQSWVRSVLDQGETYSQSNWAKTGMSLQVEFLNNIPSPDNNISPFHSSLLFSYFFMKRKISKNQGMTNALFSCHC
mmetsp:Transcript_26835/g.40296  ORF Transcript_26835/g.40296 Transcript_26835/m.40296 type:complete len:508 (+) Transcript_26835:55-1578(+)